MTDEQEPMDTNENNNSDEDDDANDPTNSNKTLEQKLGYYHCINKCQGSFALL